MRGSKWTEDEVSEIRRMAGEFSIAAMARELGRPYGGVACKLSELGISGRANGTKSKLPRGAGYDKTTTLKRTREIDSFTGSLSQYCRANSIRLDPFVKAIQRHAPDWWHEYARTHTDLPSEECPYCGTTFYPMTKKQKTCSRRCQSLARSDADYFGGRRREAVGLSEGICQLCFEPKTSLAAHHMRGKENDPHNKYLIALCQGCHQTVSRLAGRKFIKTAEGWENLIGIVMMRYLGDKPAVEAVHTYVEMEFQTLEDLVEEDDDLAVMFDGQLDTSTIHP